MDNKRHARHWHLPVGKMLIFFSVLNLLQIAAVITLTALALALRPWYGGGPRLSWSIAAAGVAALAGVYMGTVHTFANRDLLRQTKALLDTAHSLETLNNKLRAQRHDFMNHLQVIGSLLELNENAEALAYIEKVYGDVQAVGRYLRTAIPAVNALLMVKQAECEQHGIDFQARITSDWSGLVIPGWEMCRVLGNLIDNARDALEGVASPRLTVNLYDDMERYRFDVTDNGPTIPDNVKGKLFDTGYTTKSSGQGFGLYIARDILVNAGGDVSVQSDVGATTFYGWVPRKAPEKM